MQQDRRDFLKTAAVVGATLAAVGESAAQMQTRPNSGDNLGVARKMILASLRRGGGYGLAVRTDKGLVDIAAAEQEARSGVPTTVEALIRGDGNVAGLSQLVESASAAGKHMVALDKAEFGPCVTNPQKILCIGLNYRKHAAETGNPVPKLPILFNKFNTALNHHGGTIAVSKEKAEKFDYEAELVIVLGRSARNVSEADAKSYILGYATGNDFTARDLQSRSSQWMLGKALDGSAPLGPWLVGADLVDGDNLKIEQRVNGEVRQSSNTNDMVFNCSQLVSYISQHMTLNAGDIIFTGTPEGVISGYPKDKQVWLKPGDKLVTSIEKLGDLEFTLT